MVYKFYCYLFPSKFVCSAFISTLYQVSVAFRFDSY